MNKKLQVLSTLIFFIGCSKVTNEDTLIEKSSVTYAKGSSVPFTGEVIGKYDSGQERIKGKYIEGKREDLWIFLHKNGKESEKGEYSNSSKKGDWSKWYENGILESRGTYSNGRVEGLWKFWYNNGTKEKEITFVDGKENGQSKGWYSNGKEKNIIHYSIGSKNGEYMEWDQNGNKISDGIFKSGKRWNGYFGDEHYINGPKGSLFIQIF